MFIKGIESDKSIKFCDPFDIRWLLAKDINYETPVITQFGVFSSDDDKTTGSVITPNGKIYCPPFNHTSILEFDPNEETVNLLGNFGALQYKWQSISLAPDGKLYCHPRTIKKYLEIDTLHLPQKDYMCWHPYFNKM